MLDAFIKRFVVAECASSWDIGALGQICIDIEPREIGPCVLLDSLLESPAGTHLRRMFDDGVVEVPLSELLCMCARDDVSRTLGKNRRHVARTLLSLLAKTITSFVEVSRGDDMWQTTSLAQLQL